MSAHAIREQIGTEIYQVSVHDPALSEAEFLQLLTPEERAHQLPLAGFVQSGVGHFPDNDGFFALIKLPFNWED